MVLNYITQSLEYVPNCCVKESIYATVFKKALVIPFYKNGNDSDVR